MLNLSELKRIVIGILVYNKYSINQRVLPQLIADLAATSVLLPEDFKLEIVILDNASQDGTRELLEGLQKNLKNSIPLTVLFSEENTGVEAYNKIFDYAFSEKEEGFFVEADNNIRLKTGNFTVPIMIANFRYLTEVLKKKIGFLGLDYYIGIRSREFWEGAESFATSLHFMDGTEEELAVNGDELLVYLSLAFTSKLLLYNVVEAKGMSFGGFRLTTTEVWRDIGGQPKFLYGTDRTMNKSTLAKGYTNVTITNCRLQKFETQDRKYREWKNQYLEKNVIMHGGEEAWRGLDTC